MTDDPLKLLRANAPQPRPPGADARRAAYEAAVTSPFDRVAKTTSVRKWWLSGVGAVVTAILVTTGTALPASAGTPAPPASTYAAPAVAPAAPTSTVLYLTHPDGTVYEVKIP